MFIHIAEFSSYVKINGIPFCVCVCVCVCVCMRVFFIHSSVHGQLGCFHILAIVNSAAMNMEGLTSILLGKYPEVGLLDHMVVLFSIFEESPYCFP